MIKKRGEMTWWDPVDGGVDFKSGPSNLRRRSMVENVSEGDGRWARGTDALGYLSRIFGE